SLTIRLHPSSTLFPYTTLFRSPDLSRIQNSAFYFESVLNYDRIFNDKHKIGGLLVYTQRSELDAAGNSLLLSLPHRNVGLSGRLDRKSTRLNSSHVKISYAVFC